MIFGAFFKFFFFNDRKNLFFSLLALLLAMGSFLLLYWQITPRVTPVPLRYNIYFGIDLIGPWYYVFYLPLVGFAINLAHIVLSMILEKKDSLFPKLFAINSFVCNLIIFILSILIILLNS